MSEELEQNMSEEIEQTNNEYSADSIQVLDKIFNSEDVHLVRPKMGHHANMIIIQLSFEYTLAVLRSGT